ncbi:hypothetical protein AMTRI_Chr12g268470 [Amborella trichopoda]
MGMKVKESESVEMDTKVRELESLLNYKFSNPQLLKVALTHASCSSSASLERLEFLGDAALGNAFAKHLFESFPDLNPGKLTPLRAANVSTERLARVAVKHGFFDFLFINSPSLQGMVSEFTDTVNENPEDCELLMKAPKVLADVVESIAGAVFVDCDYNLQKLWDVFHNFFEPIITPSTLKIHPKTELLELCQKQGKQLEFIHKQKGKGNVFDILVDGQLIGSGESEVKETAEISAARVAMNNLRNGGAMNDVITQVSSPSVHQGDLIDERNCFIPMNIGEEREFPRPMTSNAEERELPTPIASNAEERELPTTIESKADDKELLTHIESKAEDRKLLRPIKSNAEARELPRLIASNVEEREMPRPVTSEDEEKELARPETGNVEEREMPRPVTSEDEEKELPRPGTCNVQEERKSRRPLGKGWEEKESMKQALYVCCGKKRFGRPVYEYDSFTKCIHLDYGFCL